MTESFKKNEVHAHRGGAAYYPENTLPAFAYALQLGVDALEMDLVLSKDRQVVVSHEPYMHHEKCLTPQLNRISEQEEKKYILEQMDYAEIKKFDCGLVASSQFPERQNILAFKPLLTDVIQQSENNNVEKNYLPFKYNLEIKSNPKYTKYTQQDKILIIEKVIEEIYRYKIESRVVIQSFDKEILQLFKRRNSSISLALLVEDNICFERHITDLGFKPEIFSCDYIYMTQNIVDQLHSAGIKVYVYTINKQNDIQHFIKIGVDAIITDYPEQALQIRKAICNL